MNATIFRGSRASALVAAVLALLANVACRPAAPGAAPRSLAVGEVVETALAVGAVDRYAFAARSGALVHLAVEQRGVDLVVVLRAPGGARAVEIDSPNRRWGPEEIWWSLPEAGRWQVEVRAFRPAASGRYAIRIAALGPPTALESARLAAFRAGLAAAAPGAPEDSLTRACALWRAAGEPQQEAQCALRQGERAAASGAPPLAERAMARAIELVRELGDGRQETYLSLRLGAQRRRVGDFAGAAAAQRRALDRARALGLRDDQASALNNLGLIHVDRGEIRAALPLYRRAAEILLGLGDREAAAAVLHNEGVGHSLLGRFDLAAERLDRALVLRREVGDRAGECATLTERGWVERLRARFGGGPAPGARARTFLERALACRREVGDPLGEAGTLDRFGTLLRDLGDRSAARAAYERSEGLSARSATASAARDVAYSLSNQAELWLEGGDLARAERLARAALDRQRALPGVAPEAEAHVRFLLGRIAARRGDGDPAAARALMEDALGRFEALRSGLTDATLTVPFFAVRQDYFEGALGALLDLDERFPGRGFKGAALQVAERARRRSLLDGLIQRERGERGAPALREEEAFDLAALAGLFDERTLLLEFALAEERGALFALGRGALASARIPGRRALRPLVRALRQDFAAGRSESPAVRRLASALLGGLARHLAARPNGGASIRRLAIVRADGLSAVPFAALPWETPVGERPLIERFEIVQLPSAAALLAQRRRRAEPASGVPRIAVLADPVFSARDSRVEWVAAPAGAAPTGGAELARAVRAFGLAGLARLPGTRREADAIAALAPGSPLALDFAADRAALASAPFRRAEILHLATHALAHPREPDLSGIVLSLVDAAGRPRPGFLRAGEIAALDLDAQLVVLSACETALGPEVQGEGMMGLARAFLHAGASGVVASLWKVKDRATARFMERFYRALLHDHLSPAAALRRAQLEQRADPRTSDPADWAGFELQGDWR